MHDRRMQIRLDLGFTLIELMVAVVVVGVLATTAMPAFTGWVQDAKTRTLAEALQNGIRLAQTEAVRRGLQVEFFLTDADPALNAVASTTGRNWGIRSITPSNPTAPLDFVQGANLITQGATVVVSATNAAIRFNPIGRLNNVANAVQYDLTNPKGSRRLRVNVSVSGSVRMCDPDKTRATSPDGCV